MNQCLLSSMAFRDALWWKASVSVHKTVLLGMLSNNGEVTKNGKNTGSPWTSERKEGELFPRWSEKT